MKILYAGLLLSISSLCLAMVQDPATITNMTKAAALFIHRNELHNLSPHDFPLLIQKLHNDAYVLPAGLLDELKKMNIAHPDGKIIDPFSLSQALHLEAQQQWNLWHVNNTVNGTPAILIGTALEAIYKKTNCQQPIALALLQKIDDPRIPLPQDVEALLKQEGILDQAGKVTDPEGLSYALQNKASVLRPK